SVCDHNSMRIPPFSCGTFEGDAESHALGRHWHPAPRRTGLGSSYQEARLAYVVGLFLFLTDFALLEVQIEGLLYAAGLERAKRMSIEDLIRRANEDGYIA